MTRRDAPATHRNREAILDVLVRWLMPNENEPEKGPTRVLEIASGSGQHASYFGSKLPHLNWQPSDHDRSALASIDGWASEAIEEAGAQIAPAVVLDARSPVWPIDSADVVFNANMIHISPWAVAEGLFAGAGRILSHGGLLFLYGPFRIGGNDTSPSNAAFDADLRRRHSEWGVRDLERVEALARDRGLEPIESNEMPANNKLIVFRKSA